LAIFQRRGDPAAKLQRDLEGKLKDKLSLRDEKAEQLRAAESKLAECRANVEALAVESDETALDSALQARRAAEDKVAALEGASVKIGNEITDLEAQVEQIVDQRMRSETSAAVSAMADRLEAAQIANEAAAKELEAAAREAGLLIPEAVAVAEFTRSAIDQLPAAIAQVTGLLRGYAKGVLAGHGKASLPKPAPEPPKLQIVPSEPTTNLFVMRNIRYVASGREVVCCGRNRRHDLPARIAELALSSGAAVPLSDRKRITDLEGTSGMLVPTPQACEWIGPKGREPAPLSMRPGGPPPVHSSLSAFEPYDRGKPFTGTMPRGPEPEPLPMTGTRSEEDGEA
jgi:hypothetical protein